MAAPKWLSIWPSADPATNIAVLLSAIALLASVKSCAVSQDALTETRTQFRQERQLVLKGEFKHPEGTGCSTIKAVPIAEGFQFQRGEAHLPRQMYDKPVVIEPDGSFVFDGNACIAVGKYSAKRMPPKPGYVSVSTGDIPIFIKSSYAAKGEAYDDVSLYVLHGTIAISGDPDDWPSIQFSGLSFVRRLPADQPLRLRALDELLAKRSFAFPPKTP